MSAQSRNVEVSDHDESNGDGQEPESPIRRISHEERRSNLNGTTGEDEFAWTFRPPSAEIPEWRRERRRDSGGNSINSIDEATDS
jgi:hypothetical protein